MSRRSAGRIGLKARRGAPIAFAQEGWSGRVTALQIVVAPYDSIARRTTVWRKRDGPVARQAAIATPVRVWR